MNCALLDNSCLNVAVPELLDSPPLGLLLVELVKLNLLCWQQCALHGCLQIEVNNTQSYHFDRGHSMWRYILLPKGDLQLPVLTRLTLNRDGTKVRQ